MIPGLGAGAAGLLLFVLYGGSRSPRRDTEADERRGEVTAAFITCIYVLVATSLVSVGLLDLRVSLSVAVEIVAGALACAALAAVVWIALARVTAGG